MESVEKDNGINKRLWETHSELIRQLISLRPSYEQLASEAAYILEKRLQEANIKFAAVTCRAKTLDSFLEKLGRKTYCNPLEEVTDLAGVRIVHLYSNDFELIREIISQEFKVIEPVDDNPREQSADSFGYKDEQFIVHLGQKSSGARYDDLKSIKCEIQVRTVAQDAWAIISHHLIYKRKGAPIALQRKLNALAGVFETADDQFNQIRLESERHLKGVETSLANDQGLDQEINVNTVVAFLKHYFPDAERESSEKHISKILDSLDRERYKTLKDLKNLLDKKPDEIEKHKGMVLKNGKPSWSAAFILASVLEFERYGVSPD